MRTATVYLVDRDHSPHNEQAAPTLKLARDAAREEAEHMGHAANIYRVKVPLVPARERVCNLLNHERFVADRTYVETYVPERILLHSWEDDGPRWSYRVDGRGDG